MAREINIIVPSRMRMRLNFDESRRHTQLGVYENRTVIKHIKRNTIKDRDFLIFGVERFQKYME